MAPPPRLAVHFSQLAIITSLVSLAIEYAERGGQRTILGSLLDIIPPDRRPPMEALVRNEGQG